MAKTKPSKKFSERRKKFRCDFLALIKNTYVNSEGLLLKTFIGVIISVIPTILLVSTKEKIYWYLIFAGFFWVLVILTFLYKIKKKIFIDKIVREVGEIYLRLLEPYEVYEDIENIKNKKKYNDSPAHKIIVVFYKIAITKNLDDYIKNNNFFHHLSKKNKIEIRSRVSCEVKNKINFEIKKLPDIGDQKTFFDFQKMSNDNILVFPRNTNSFQAKNLIDWSHEKQRRSDFVIFEDVKTRPKSYYGINLNQVKYVQYKKDCVVIKIPETSKSIQISLEEWFKKSQTSHRKENKK